MVILKTEHMAAEVSSNKETENRQGRLFVYLKAISKDEGLRSRRVMA